MEDIADINDMKLSPKEIMDYNCILTDIKKLEPAKIVMMVDIINGKSELSLRMLDWFVTKFVSTNRVSYKYIDGDIEYEGDIYNSYKAQLKSYTKDYFDPFRRGKKFKLKYDKTDLSKVFITTIGQLNFFRWVFEYNIIVHIHANYKALSNKMKDATKVEKAVKPVSKKTPKSEQNSNLVSSDATDTQDGILLSFD